jgi:signal peptidase II
VPWRSIRLIKYLVETRLPFHELIPVMPMLGLFRTWNEGIAFSLLKRSARYRAADR